MSMAGYTKLFSSILGSSVWCLSKDTKILWITLLAMADQNGEAEIATPGLARMAGLTIEETERGLVDLSSPDKFSRTKEHEGRRIEEIPGGWRLLNHPKYRAKMGADDRREYKAAKQREYRARDSASKKSSTSGRGGHNAEAEAKADANRTTTTRGGKPLASSETREALRAAITELSTIVGRDFDRVAESVTSGKARTGKRQCQPCINLERISEDQAKRSILDANSLIEQARIEA